MLLLLGALIAGMLTVLAPCVLPLLPVIIGGSVTGNTGDRRRPVIIVVALAVSLMLFTVLLKATSLLINVSPQAIAEVSGGIIVALGLLMLFPMVYVRFVAWSGLEAWAQRRLGSGAARRGQWLGPVLTGAALGPVFSSCSPVYAYILASVLPVNFGQALGYMVAYVAGLSVVLLLIGYYGQRFVQRIRFASNPSGWFQRTVAVLFIIVGLMVATGYDKRFQTWVLGWAPDVVSSLSTRLLPPAVHPTTNALLNVSAYPAPELTGLSSWINSQPLKLAQLRGKVVLVDFWTFSCINCIRNDPYLEKWYETYKSDGLVVIGVHAPEFAFEKVPANVRKAVAADGLTYPVALDNNLATWAAFNNESWPASYLIDKDGLVRRIHEGEGDYQQSEEAIRQLLTEDGAKLGGLTTTGHETVPITNDQTPETYFGAARASGYAGSPDLDTTAVQTYSAPATLDTGEWALRGRWEVDGDKIVARGGSTLSFHVAAKDVYLVGSSSGAASVGVTYSRTSAEQPAFIAGAGVAGSDVTDGSLRMNGARLYHLLSFPSFTSEDTVTLSVPDGVELNTFTFGS